MLVTQRRQLQLICLSTPLILTMIYTLDTSSAISCVQMITSALKSLFAAEGAHPDEPEPPTLDMVRNCRRIREKVPFPPKGKVPAASLHPPPPNLSQDAINCPRLRPAGGSGLVSRCTQQC